MKTPTENNSNTRQNIALIALGSNIDATTNMPLAFEAIAQLGNIKQQTDCIVTAAIGTPPGTENYTNAALLLHTDLGLDDLTRQLKSIEDNQGRIRSTIDYHPVSIDLDVTTFNGIIVDKDLYKLPFLQDLVRELQPELLPKK